MLDTLKYSKQPQSAGVSPAQADAQAKALREAIAESVATKAQLDGVAAALHSDLSAVAQRLDTKFNAAEQRLDAKIEGTEQRVDSKIDTMEQNLSAEIQTGQRRCKIPALGGRTLSGPGNRCFDQTASDVSVTETPRRFLKSTTSPLALGQRLALLRPITTSTLAVRSFGSDVAMAPYICVRPARME